MAMSPIDGLRAAFATGGIVHLRPSVNAPELRCHAGSDTVSEAKKCLSKIYIISHKIFVVSILRALVPLSIGLDNGTYVLPSGHR